MPRQVRETLTKRDVESAKPRATVYTLRDNNPGGLILRIRPTGRKSWAVVWGGKGQARNIGDFPVMTLAGARIEANKVLAEIAQHGAPVKAARGAVETFGDYMAEYGPYVEATAKAGKATPAAIKSVFGAWYARSLTSLRSSDWDALKAERLRAKKAPATVNRDLDRIKAALQQAVEWGYLSDNPLAKSKRIKRGIEKRVRYLTPDEAKALRTSLEDREIERKAARLRGEQWREERGVEALGAFEGYTDHVAPIILLALNTGLRRGELRQLTWKDVDFPRQVLTVRAGVAKSGKARHVPLNAEALRILEAWRSEHPGAGPVFGIASIKTAWDGLMTAAKIENFRFHDMRHDFASRLVMAGVDLNTVRELLGHGDITMTLRYAHLAPAKLADAVARLSD